MPKILVVDDEAAMRLIISKKIHAAFDVVITEANGVAEAISYLQTQSFDFVICDYWMDDGVGSEVSQYITENMKGTPRLVLFSSDNEVVSQYLRDGVHDAILKPNFEGLISIVHKNIPKQYALQRRVYE